MYLEIEWIILFAGQAQGHKCATVKATGYEFDFDPRK